MWLGIIVNVLLVGAAMGFLCWFVPRVIRRIVRSEFARVILEVKATCPVANSIVGRVSSLEAKESQASEQRREDRQEVARLDREVQAAREREAEAKRVPRPAGDFGMTSSWGGR